MPKILISTSSFNVNANGYLDILQREGFEIDQNPYGRRLTESEVMELLHDDVVGLIAGVEPLTQAVIVSAKKLKVISRCGIGMDSVDSVAAKKHEIQVYNTPGAPVDAVAELSIALILSLLRKVVEADRNIRQGGWKPLMGNLLSCQTVGVIGYGRIGKRVSQLLQAFGSKVIVFDEQEVPDEPGIEVYPMNDVLRQADIVTLHVPYSSSTHHLIDHEKISRMKSGAILINSSRGGVIDEQALLSALQSGALAGAGLDAFEEEPYQGPLLKLPQVVLTAHMGSYAKEARMNMENEAAKNLLMGLRSKGIVGEHVGMSDEG